MRGIVPYLLICLLIVFSAFFSASEISYAGLSDPFVHRLQSSRKRNERRAAALRERFDTVLVTILVGNNLVNIASSSVATVIAVELMGEEGAWVATAVMTVVILTFGEVIPKILASRFAREYAVAVSLPLQILRIVTFPLVWCITKLMRCVSRLWKNGVDEDSAVTEEDLETILETAEDEGVVDEDTADLLQSALDFGDVLAWEILTPRVDLFALDLDEPAEELRAALLRTSHSRIPVYRETVDNVVGILHLDRYLRLAARDPDVPPEAAVRPARFIHKTMPIAEALRIMQREKTHMVIVTDEYGGTMGVLTMEDVLEQLVGEIWDEGDVVHEEFRKLSEQLYEADGNMRLQDFFDELELENEETLEDDNATLGGWVIQKLGHYPASGESFSWENLTVTVRRLRQHRVLSVIVRVTPLPEEEEDDLF